MKTYLQGSWFRQLPGRRPIVFATRGAIGLADGFPREAQPTDGQRRSPIPGAARSMIEDLPASERFFAGGDTTIRGFALDTVGRAGDDQPQRLPARRQRRGHPERRAAGAGVARLRRGGLRRRRQRVRARDEHRSRRSCAAHSGSACATNRRSGRSGSIWGSSSIAVSSVAPRAARRVAPEHRPGILGRSRVLARRSVLNMRGWRLGCCVLAAIAAWQVPGARGDCRPDTCGGRPRADHAVGRVRGASARARARDAPGGRCGSWCPRRADRAAARAPRGEQIPAAGADAGAGRGASRRGACPLQRAFGFRADTRTDGAVRRSAAPAAARRHADRGLPRSTLRGRQAALGPGDGRGTTAPIRPSSPRRPGSVRSRRCGRRFARGWGPSRVRRSSATGSKA